MADKTPEELAAEVERLQRANQSLSDKLQSGGARAELARVTQENETLRGALQRQAAEQGPARGTEIRYRRAGENFSRPGRILSRGFTERVPVPGGFKHFAYLEYGDPEHFCDDPSKHHDETLKVLPEHAESHACGLLPHKFECSAPYDPTFKESTWCFPEDEEQRVAAEAETAKQAEARRNQMLGLQAP